MVQETKNIKNIITSAPLPIFATIASKNKWKIRPHLVAIAQEINNTLKYSKIEYLIVNMPPRHGKSEMMSKYFPAWFLLNNPSKRIIFTTYSENFAQMYGRFVQDLYIQNMKYFGVGIYERRQSAGEWLTNEGGGMVSVGAGGSLTGRGGDIIIIDDPIKNAEQALSPLIKSNLEDWFYSTVVTRLEPNGKIFIIMTRWQPDDLTGRILQLQKPDSYIHLKLQAISEKKEFFRLENEALWSERYNIDELIHIKEKITNYWFNAMYQQEPSNKGSEYIPSGKFERYTDTGDVLICVEKNMIVKKFTTSKFATVDLAISTKSTADYTVILIFYVDQNSNIFIENIFRLRLPPDQHEEELKRIFDEYQIKVMGIESVAYQETLIQRLLSKGLAIERLIPDKNKETRLLNIIPHLVEGKIYLKSGASWIKDFEDELKIFPNGSHDDQVDAFSYIANFLRYSTSNKIGSSSGKKNGTFF